MEDIGELLTTDDYVHQHPEAKGLESMALDAQKEILHKKGIVVSIDWHEAITILRVESFNPATGVARFVVTDLKYERI